jgi:two-component system phosphate regulon response regulator PhoB
MDIVTIFLTGRDADGLAPFENDDTQIVFDRLTSEGPRRIAEGQVWAFIDWVLEDMSGLELCRRLRSDPRMADAHITMVLDHADDSSHDEDRRRALKAGADDYIVGPVDRHAMLDRVFALRSPCQQRRVARVIELGALTIDLGSLQARWGDERLALRPNEFRLLRFFAENPDRVLSRQDLIAGLGKQEPPIDERTVDVWVGRLRRALQQAGAGQPLRTVRSMGYVFDSE